MKLLLHTCCAPCSVYCIDVLQKEGIQPTLYWYNPNIHPYMEYKQRKDTFIKYVEFLNLEYVLREEYGLREFTKNVIDNLENRCEYCYIKRLESTAIYAKENGYDAFSTTLLISPYQQHDRIKQIAENIAQKIGIKFLYQDFRVGFRKGQAKARELQMYMQKYCGCVFSEEERYLNKKGN